MLALCNLADTPLDYSIHCCPVPRAGSVNPSFLTNASAYTELDLDHNVETFARNITRVGQFPDLRLPLLRDGFGVNSASMQKLCSKTQFGEAAPGQHAGG